MRKLTHNRARVVVLGLLALLVAGGSALAATRGGTTVKKGILTYDAAASASPTQTVIGTLLGGTWSADCNIPAAGEAQVRVYLQTSDGSWKADFSTIIYDSSTTTEDAIANSLAVPAGTLVTPVLAISATAPAGGEQQSTHTDIVQLGPLSGHIILHTNATTESTATCHVSIEVATDKIVRATPVVAATTSTNLSRPLLTR